MRSPLLLLDVAHPPRSADRVEQELLEAWGTVRNSIGLRILKVVHGYGSSGKGGSTKETVRNWIFRNRSKFKSVIEGENFNLYHVATQDLIKEVGSCPAEDRDNPGITIIWVK